ncbi:hypothetical protein A3Q56_04337 [Intoshia linei]|uniref:RRM domain-containing protein n=1 Tax=Intoshia linei TaxID=1819745 RepID=A0A177B375_9BILA|nr:hypothetical protein A3Q56_04337 [Intoshia linei]
MRIKRLYIGHLTSSARRKDVEDFFKGYGKIIDVHLKNGYGFVEFDDYQDAEDALNDLANKKICGQPINLEYAKMHQNRYSNRGDYRNNYKDSNYRNNRYDNNHRVNDKSRPDNSSSFHRRHKPKRYRALCYNVPVEMSLKNLKNKLKEYVYLYDAYEHYDDKSVIVLKFSSRSDMDRCYQNCNDLKIDGNRIRIDTSEKSYTPDIVKRQRSDSISSKSSYRSYTRSRSKSLSKTGKSVSYEGSQNRDSSKNRKFDKISSKSKSVSKNRFSESCSKHSKSPSRDLEPPQLDTDKLEHIEPDNLIVSTTPTKNFRKRMHSSEDEIEKEEAKPTYKNLKVADNVTSQYNEQDNIDFAFKTNIESDTEPEKIDTFEKIKTQTCTMENINNHNISNEITENAVFADVANNTQTDGNKLDYSSNQIKLEMSKLKMLDVSAETNENKDQNDSSLIGDVQEEQFKENGTKELNLDKNLEDQDAATTVKSDLNGSIEKNTTNGTEPESADGKVETKTTVTKKRGKQPKKVAAKAKKPVTPKIIKKKATPKKIESPRAQPTRRSTRLTNKKAV